MPRKLEGGTGGTSAPLSGWGLCRLVFPVARFAFREPFHRFFEALLAGFLALRFRDPFEILAPMAGRETVEGLSRFRILLQGGGEIVRHWYWRALLRLRAAGHFSTGVVERGR